MMETCLYQSAARGFGMELDLVARAITGQFFF